MNLTPVLAVLCDRAGLDPASLGTTPVEAAVNDPKALVSFDFARGTILQRDNVVISEGPLPRCAQIRAVQHEQEETTCESALAGPVGDDVTVILSLEGVKQ